MSRQLFHQTFIRFVRKADCQFAATDDIRKRKLHRIHRFPVK